MSTLARIRSFSRSPRSSLSSNQESRDSNDPLSKALQPPPNESEEDRRQRIRLLRAAEQISREIDISIAESKKEWERRKKAIKILLLGQAESGKSSILKNFQLAFAPNYLQSERAAWKTIIHLNVITSIKRIIDALDDEWDSGRAASPAPPPSDSSSPPASPRNRIPLTPEHRRIQLGLSPLLIVGNHLNQKLLPEVNDPKLKREVCVRAGSGWKAMLGITTSSSITAAQVDRGMLLKADAADLEKVEEASDLLTACQDDIVTLWNDRAVKDILKKRDIRLEESPGFFLNDVLRVTHPDYEPTDSDIVRARLRTMGVNEYWFSVEKGPQAGTDWCVYDVGGSRSMRSFWVPYFEDVQAIIFLAPLSFHQLLEEDSKVNRVEDSISLWRQICSNKLLTKSSIILFFNKMDILRKNLSAGMQVRRFVPSYGDRANEYVDVVKYFKQKFQAYHKKLSPETRSFLCYQLSAIDTHSTQKILNGVQEGLLYQHLRNSEML